MGKDVEKRERYINEMNVCFERELNDPYQSECVKLQIGPCVESK